MMTRIALALLLFHFVPVVVADVEPFYAYVIDSSTDRIPSHTVAPEYPRKARRDRIEGRVQVCFDVDRQGRTRRVAVRHSSHRAFEKPSIKAVRASFFRALSEKENLLDIKSCRTFMFSLEPIDKDVEESPENSDQ